MVNSLSAAMVSGVFERELSALWQERERGDCGDNGNGVCGGDAGTDRLEGKREERRKNS